MIGLDIPDIKEDDGLMVATESTNFDLDDNGLIQNIPHS